MLSRSKLGLGRTEPRKSALRGPAVVKSKEAVHDTCSTASFRLHIISAPDVLDSVARGVRKATYRKDFHCLTYTGKLR